MEAVVLFATSARTSVLVIVVIVLFIVAYLGYGQLRITRLSRMPSGSTNVVTVKRSGVSRKVDQYTEAGWVIGQQSSAKSLGTHVQVTNMFRKPYWQATPPSPRDSHITKCVPANSVTCVFRTDLSSPTPSNR